MRSRRHVILATDSGKGCRRETENSSLRVLPRKRVWSASLPPIPVLEFTTPEESIEGFDEHWLRMWRYRCGTDCVSGPLKHTARVSGSRLYFVAYILIAYAKPNHHRSDIHLIALPLIPSRVSAPFRAESLHFLRHCIAMCCTHLYPNSSCSTPTDNPVVQQASRKRHRSTEEKQERHRLIRVLLPSKSKYVVTDTARTINGLTVRQAYCHSPTQSPIISTASQDL